MSIDATRATWKLGKEISAIQKLLLLSLADRAGEDGECWPSLKRIMLDTNLDRKTIIQNRQELLDMKLVEYSGEFKGRAGQVPVMRLTFIHRRERDNSPENGTGENFTSTENGTGTSTENGTGDQYRKRYLEPKRREPKIEAVVEEQTAAAKEVDFSYQKTISQQIAPNVTLTTANPLDNYNPYFVKQQILADKELLTLFEEKNLSQGQYKTIEEFFDYCVAYRKNKGKPTGLREFKMWLINEKPLAKQTVSHNELLPELPKSFSDEELEIHTLYQHATKFSKVYDVFQKGFFNTEESFKDAAVLAERIKTYKNQHHPKSVSVTTQQNRSGLTKLSPQVFGAFKNTKLQSYDYAAYKN